MPIPLVAHSTVNTIGTNDHGLCCRSSKPTARKREPHILRMLPAWLPPPFVLSACLLVFFAFFIPPVRSWRRRFSQAFRA